MSLGWDQFFEERYEKGGLVVHGRVAWLAIYYLKILNSGKNLGDYCSNIHTCYKLINATA